MKLALPLAVLIAAVAGYWLAPAAPPAVAQDRQHGTYRVVSGTVVVDNDRQRTTSERPVMLRVNADTGQSEVLFWQVLESGEWVAYWHPVRE